MAVQQRDRALDTFRGLAIVAMVFFTLLLRLGEDLPEALRHNVRGSFHLGDLVLPLFLFASGLSLGYYLHARKGLRPSDLWRDVAHRFLRLALVGIILSPWSARGWFEMDEVMLSALLFPACIALAGLDWRWGPGVVAVVTFAYPMLWAAGWDALMKGHYLGGYAAIPFYLPVMLAGLLLGRAAIVEGHFRGRRSRWIVAAVSGLLLACLLLGGSVDKLTATPAFMLLSLLVCYLLLVAVELLASRLRLPELEYLGHRPLRYWVLMWLTSLIPLQVFKDRTGTSLVMEWPLAVLASLAVLLLLWVASRLMDQIGKRLFQRAS